MRTQSTWFAVLAASVLAVGCTDTSRSTLSPSSIPDFTAADASDHNGTPTMVGDDDSGTEPFDESGLMGSDAASGARGVASAACTPAIVGPGRIAATFSVRVVPCGSWKLEADYLTDRGNWWNASILINKAGTHWSSVNDSLGKNTVTVDLSKRPRASTATQFRLVLTSDGKTATYRFSYKR